MQVIRRSGRSTPRELRGGLRHLPALLIAIAFLLPLVYMVTGSLRKAGLPPPRTPEFIPSPVALDNYPRAFELVDIPRYTLNSYLPLFIYRNGFEYLRYGYAAAATLVMFAITAGIVFIQYRIVKRWRHAFVV